MLQNMTINSDDWATLAHYVSTYASSTEHGVVPLSLQGTIIAGTGKATWQGTFTALDNLVRCRATDIQDFAHLATTHKMHACLPYHE